MAQMTDQSLEYFEEYRQKRRELEDLRKMIESAKEDIRSLERRGNSISNEISAMKRIITKMIDTGMDPVEAKLKSNLDDNHGNLWHASIVSDDDAL